ncbi:1-phosphofructokinase [Pseudoclavibacter endophyticus]|uniref:1-phosphofructokinase family hexose kinase n=1 Tax=Pseudoclavibacter endophyticus TaxID=1778590 RepID=A0A6H9WKS4_9MICO|nr:PfkB family carbohydrate kinase [Pseudoclavibacter endophyticus]KAB1648102.1 1-phosphofructokinase family hexose kinase [Pseudoclavibacter endophyticus]GGA69758.1 1-phosphofructokinase [Pseudoclavibacter endophyticus]
MPSVVTLTPAPVIDRTYFVERFDEGKVNRATDQVEFLSGKGLNVSRTLHLAGVATSAVLPIGKEDEHLLFRTPNPQLLRILRVPGRIRVNTQILEPSGRTTNINQKAVPIPADDWDEVVQMTIRELRALAADWLVVSGSVPRMAETGEHLDFDRLFAETRRLGTRIALDTSGSSLARLARSEHINLIKPNADELATLVDRHLHTVGDVLEAAHEVIERNGLEVALVSLGGDGAVAVTARETLWGHATAPRVVNTTGAGDATLAGFVGSSIQGPGRTGGRADFSELPRLTVKRALGAAVTYGALAVSVPTTIMDSLDDAPTPVVEAPDPERELSEPTKVFDVK